MPLPPCRLTYTDAAARPRRRGSRPAGVRVSPPHGPVLQPAVTSLWRTGVAGSSCGAGLRLLSLVSCLRISSCCYAARLRDGLVNAAVECKSETGLRSWGAHGLPC
ncbi:hypothetical protein BV25DRAFT_1466111 [Artomyces pyxidatus]|uniref:Uncharacterized protein n=1 Tax=Artomyces pyxidatus TaxID=48021 RepID=A0ACB8SKT5_9AGAM|nr:hypothetical protein BV25DRAFT_1466111 [Artomyces pyxidatus]